MRKLRHALLKMPLAKTIKSFIQPPPQGSLDWVYIDGDHSKNAVKTDVTLAFEIVKPGGMIAGDDYYWRDSDGSYSVKDALTELARERRVDPRSIDGQFVVMLDRA